MKDTQTLPAKCYRNRELSWLKFNERVLEEAADAANPLCERLSFLHIFQTNLDEFFMVRVGSLHDMTLLKNEPRDNKTNRTASEQLADIFEQVRAVLPRKAAIYAELLRELRAKGVTLVHYPRLKGSEKKYLEQYFTRELEPLLSTIVVGRRQPFPFLNNGDLYAVAHLCTKSDREKIGLVPCSTSVIQRLIPLPQRPGCYMLAEELLLHELPRIFKNYEVKSRSILRVTRNADIDADNMGDEEMDYREHMAQVIRQRRRLCAVRLELTRSLNAYTLNLLCEQLQLSRSQVFYSKMPADLGFVSTIQNLLRGDPTLFFPRHVPRAPADIDPARPMIDQILERDRLLSLPFESIQPFLRLLNEAAADPQVVSIRMTLYRLASHSKVVEALTEAAENGKQVDVLVELRARFDEESNIEYSHRLEDAGCHVIYGIEKRKVHSKLCLITRHTDEGVQYITQVGTGNYNEKTARLYTDLQLMTADPTIGAEAAEIFSSLSLGQVVEKTHSLLVAPKCLQNRVIEKIREQAVAAAEGKPAYIGLKLNALTDKAVIDELIRASQAGVRIEMVVRGICCLQAGLPGLTENIAVRSIVGRYLEHSRIYIFGCGETACVYISSADLMTRNTLHRVEVAAPVEDPALRRRLLELFAALWRDNCKARELLPGGKYVHVHNDAPAFNAQEFFAQAPGTGAAP